MEHYVCTNAEGEKVFVGAEIRDTGDGPNLAFQGVVIRKGGTYERDGDWVSSGQIDLSNLRDHLNRANDWTYEDVLRLAEVWERWHLNDMKAGCEHQRAEGWDKRKIDESKPSSIYGLHFAGQKSPTWNLLGWVRPSEHPDGLMTKPCPTCGYKYGTAWLREDVPDDVLAWVRERFTERRAS